MLLCKVQGVHIKCLVKEIIPLKHFLRFVLQPQTPMAKNKRVMVFKDFYKQKSDKRGMQLYLIPLLRYL